MSENFRKIITRKDELVENLANINKEINIIEDRVLHFNGYDATDYSTLKTLNKAKKFIEKQIDKIIDKELEVALNEI